MELVIYAVQSTTPPAMCWQRMIPPILRQKMIIRGLVTSGSTRSSSAGAYVTEGPDHRHPRPITAQLRPAIGSANQQSATGARSKVATVGCRAVSHPDTSSRIEQMGLGDDGQRHPGRPAAETMDGSVCDRMTRVRYGAGVRSQAAARRRWHCLPASFEQDRRGRRWSLIR